MDNATDIAKLEESVNQMILAGRAPEAFELFYHDRVVMQENTDKATEGKTFNRFREDAFYAAVESMKAKLLGGAVGKGTSYSEWEYDITFKNGVRWRLTQVARRRWEDGRIIHERFYHETFPPR